MCVCVGGGEGGDSHRWSLMAVRKIGGPNVIFETTTRAAERRHSRKMRRTVSIATLERYTVSCFLLLITCRAPGRGPEGTCAARSTVFGWLQRDTVVAAQPAAALKSAGAKLQQSAQTVRHSEKLIRAYANAGEVFLGTHAAASSNMRFSSR